ncbi:MAG TPA: hypothetical protein VLD35_16805 [Caldimonas sp.]|nr:hypothetical protein [Caldimonas sp.]
MSAQGLTYPHDFVLSRTALYLLRRIISKTEFFAKLLILLTSSACRESRQAGVKPSRTSVSGPPGGFTHKVFHSRGGELQKGRQIIDLRVVSEERLKSFQNAPAAAHGGG